MNWISSSDLSHFTDFVAAGPGDLQRAELEGKEGYEPPEDEQANKHPVSCLVPYCVLLGCPGLGLACSTCGREVQVVRPRALLE
jgi:hypothetical protein